MKRKDVLKISHEYHQKCTVSVSFIGSGIDWFLVGEARTNWWYVMTLYYKLSLHGII